MSLGTKKGDLGWITMEAKAPMCCHLSVVMRESKPDPLAKEGGSIVCEKCKTVWIIKDNTLTRKEK
jgi:uncharacterized protein YbaR (Trm112 family)